MSMYRCIDVDHSHPMTSTAGEAARLRCMFEKPLIDDRSATGYGRLMDASIGDGIRIPSSGGGSCTSSLLRRSDGQNANLVATLSVAALSGRVPYSVVLCACTIGICGTAAI